MSTYYTTKQASQLSGASRQVIRVYTTRYARYLSTEATPHAGMDRRFTADDLKLLAFIYQRTQTGETHDQVLERLQAGELEQFAWQPPESPPTPEQQSDDESASSALVPLERLQAAHILLQDSQRREAATADQVTALQAEVQRLSLELGQALGQAAALKESRYKAPVWWRALFGGRGDS